MALVGSTFVMVIVGTRKSFTTGKEVLNANDNFVGRRGTNESCKASLQTGLQEKAERVGCEQKIKYKIDLKVKGQ